MNDEQKAEIIKTMKAESVAHLMKRSSLPEKLKDRYIGPEVDVWESPRGSCIIFRKNGYYIKSTYIKSKSLI